MVSNDAMGITSQGIQAACQMLEISDLKECYVKVMELANRTRMAIKPVKQIEEE